jgi:hypothetical protein
VDGDIQVWFCSLTEVTGTLCALQTNSNCTFSVGYHDLQFSVSISSSSWYEVGMEILKYTIQQYIAAQFK